MYYGLKDYTLHSTLKRGAKVKHWEDISLDLEFTFPVNEHGDNKLEIVTPTFIVFEQQQESGTGRSAASLLDDFVSLKYDLRVVYNPAPDKGNPRLTICAEATPERIYVY